MVIKKAGNNKLVTAVVDLLTRRPCFFKRRLTGFNLLNPLVLNPDIHMFPGGPLVIDQGNVMK